MAEGLAWIETNLDPARRYKGGAPNATAHTATLAKAKRRYEIVKLQHAWLAFEREQGKLIDADEARRTVFARARAERDAHLAWSSAVRPYWPPSSAPIPAPPSPRSTG